MRSPLLPVLALAVAAAFLPQSAAYGADEKAACIAASEKAQQLRDDGKLMQARQQMLSCARDVCPNAIRKDCSAYLTTLDATLPTIVVSAQDSDHHDLFKVKVTADGQPLVDSLDGKAIPIDPGPHTFKFEAEGQKPVEQNVLVREGEQRRGLAVVFPGSGTTGGATLAPTPSATPSASAGPTQSAPVPVATYVFGGLGVIALGSFIGFGLKGTGDLSALRSDPCATTHNCAQSDVDAVKTKLIIADVSLGASIVSLGLATYFFFARGTVPQKSTGSLRWDVAPFAPGATAGTTVGVHF